MPNRLSTRYNKQGLPPGTPRYTGTAEGGTRIRALDVRESGCEDFDNVTPEHAVHLQREPTLTWIDITGLSDESTLLHLFRHLGVHKLAAEDILQVGTRPKVEVFEDQIVVVLKMVHTDVDENDDLVARIEHVSIVVGHGYIMTLQELPDDPFDGVRRHLRDGVGGIRNGGQGRLLHALVDAVVDDCYDAIELLGREVEELEARLLEDPPDDALARIQEQRTVTLLMRRAVRPIREVLVALRKVDSPVLPDRLDPYWNDVADHLDQILESLELYREMVMGMVDLHHTAVSNKLNDTMRVLTVISVLFLPLSFLAGLYGMNFAWMPELQVWWGYPALLSVMIALGLGMAGWFKWRGWL